MSTNYEKFQSYSKIYLLVGLFQQDSRKQTAKGIVG